MMDITKKVKHGKNNYHATLIVYKRIASIHATQISYRVEMSCTATFSRSQLSPLMYFKEELQGFEECVNMPLDRNGSWWHENALYVAMNGTNNELAKQIHCHDPRIIQEIKAFCTYAITPKYNGFHFAADDEQKEMFKRLCDKLGLEEYWSDRYNELIAHLSQF